MSDDLISRKELRKAFKKSQFFTEVNLYYARQLIDNAPTVEQECYITGAQWNEFMKEHKRQQGEWKCTFHSSFPQYEPDEYRCSICNGRGGKLDKFCKHCGAKMKDGAE